MAKIARAEAACAYGDHKHSPTLKTVSCSTPTARAVMHDKAGCKPVCWAHAVWYVQQRKQPWTGGHGKDCPGYPDASHVETEPEIPENEMDHDLNTDVE